MSDRALASQRSALRRRAGGCLGVGGLLAAAVLGALIWRSLRPQPDEQPIEPLPAQAAAPTLPNPPPRSHTGYVGSQACRECHAQASDHWHSYGMGRSLAEVAVADAYEDWNNVSFSPAAHTRYVVERTPDGFFHTEEIVDANGEVICAQREQVRYTVGSGAHGRAYLIDRGGALFQSPIGWYAQSGEWGLSPGFQPERNQRFGRRIDSGCLYCHVGAVDQLTNSGDRFREPPFLEQAIGCERCHGPGQAHVDKQSSAAVRGPDSSIVNPARLAPPQRDAVCFQCHLQGEGVLPRKGHDHFSFRPGDLLEDVWIVFVRGERVDERGQTRAVSHVEQMISSDCYKNSDGRLSCTSCHDAHRPVDSGAADSWYRERCLTCHSQQGCSLDLAQQQAPPASGSCIACHMPRLGLGNVPHTAGTDHRVLRKPQPGQVAAVRSLPTEWQVFHATERKLSPEEVARARGLLLMDIAAEGQNPAYAEDAAALLKRSVAAGGSQREPEDDLAVLEALGVAAALSNQGDQARRFWRAALKAEPDRETAMRWLLIQGLQDGLDRRQLVELTHRLTDLNPFDPQLWLMQANLLLQVRDASGALAAAQRAVELDATLVTARQIWADAAEQLGQAEEAAEQRRIIERLQAVLPQPLGASP